MSSKDFEHFRKKIYEHIGGQDAKREYLVAEFKAGHSIINISNIHDIPEDKVRETIQSSTKPHPTNPTKTDLIPFIEGQNEINDL